jgi:mannose-6-phosphate isomerase-like protein (cupin superfamily)
MSTLDVIARQATALRETPYGSVGVVHEGRDLRAWWIWKDGEDVDPAFSVCDREDFLYVVRGSLRLELDGREPLVLDAGDAFVIPPDTPYRGYRWPRDGDPCLFLAVSAADAAFSTSS